MEQILVNLLSCDSNVIRKATQDLHEALENHDCVLELCKIVVSSKEIQIRQYAAMLLGKRFRKLRNWQKVPSQHKEIIKHEMLNALVNEQEKLVRNAIARLVGVLIKHESNKNDSWENEVLKLVYNYCNSIDLKQNEIGSSLFVALVDTAPDQFMKHIDSICQMFISALETIETKGNIAKPIIFNIIQAMTSLVPFILGNNGAERTYQKAIPFIIKSLQDLFVQDPETFIQAFEFLDNLADYAPKLLTSYVKSLVEFCLAISMNSNLDNSVRVKVISYVGFLIKLKKRIIIKQKLIEPITHVLFTLMAIMPENEDEDEDYFTDNDTSTLLSTSSQTLDLLALHIPPEKLMPPLLQLLDPALKGNNPSPKRAAFICMAVITEGCSEAICAKYLTEFLSAVKIGITDQDSRVRNAAFFALGQFSEHLQPEISKYASHILPILFEYLQQLCNNLKNSDMEPKYVDRMFYALETYCENLQDDIIPYLPSLMEKLFLTLNFENSVHLRELSFSAVSATASAAKLNMLPYFSTLIEILKPYLTKTDNQEICTLRPNAVDTLAALTRTVGKENFMPLANDTTNFCLTFLEEENDPDLQRSLYNLVSALAETLNEDVVIVTEKVIGKIIESILSTEEVIPQSKQNSSTDSLENDANNKTYSGEIDIEYSDEDEDSEKLTAFTVENAYLDEKEQAISTLKDLADYTGALFVPYLHLSFQHVFKVIDHPQEDIRKISIEALTSFTIAFHKQNKSQDALEAVTMLIPKLQHIIKEDEECTVVISAIESLSELLTKLKQIAIPNKEIQDIVFSCIYDVLCGKLACQCDDSIDDEDQESESEYDEALIESAGNLLPVFGQALSPDLFAVYFEKIYPILIRKIEKAMNNENLESQRSFAYGALAECFNPLKSFCGTYIDILLPHFLIGLKDSSDQVRQNSAFGIGELALFAGENSFNAYPQILSAFSNSVVMEKHHGTLDNICGAISRLIINNCHLIPLNQVLPVLVAHLPLKEDFDENMSIFKSFQVLYAQGCTVVLSYIEQYLGFAFDVLYKKQYKDEDTYNIIIHFLKEMEQQFPEKFLAVVNRNTEIADFIQSL